MRAGSIPVVGAVWLALVLVAGSTALAREPGVAPSIPPGVTAGQANAVPLTPGVRVATRTTYEDSKVLGNRSQFTGLSSQVAGQSVLVTWVPGFDLLGGSFKTFVLMPFLDFTLNVQAPAPKETRGTFNYVGVGNPLFQIADLSWSLGNGFYINAGFGLILPIGQYHFNAPINLGAPFWTFEPSLSFSYFKDGWTVSAQAFYDINTINPVNNYLSGNQLTVNGTLMKRFGAFNIGPVGYWSKQTTGDANYGGPRVYRGLTSPPGDELAIGAAVSTQFGNLSVQLMFTQDIYAQNSISATKGWLALSYHFK